MNCTRCNSKSFNVIRTYSVDAVGATQDRICSDCGHSATTVVMELREEMSAYRARRVLGQFEVIRKDQASEADKDG